MISFQCEHCQKRLKAPPQKAGKRVKCPNCGTPTAIPTADTAPPEHIESAPSSATDELQHSHAASPAEIDSADEVPMTLVQPGPAAASETAPAIEAAPLPSAVVPTIDPSVPPRPVRKRRRRSLLPLAIWAVLLSVLGGLAWYSFNAEPPPPQMATIQPMEVNELEQFTFQVKTRDADPWKDRIEFHLKDNLEGAKLDAKSGKFTWTPTEDQGPAKFDLTVVMLVKDRADLSQEQNVQVTVNETNNPPTLYRIENMTVSAGDVLTYDVRAEDFDIPKSPLRYKFSEKSAVTAARIDAATGKIYWKTDETLGGRGYEFEVVVTETTPPGLSARQFFHVNVLEAAGPLKKLIADINSSGMSASPMRKEDFPPFLQESQLVRIGNQQVRFFEYFSAEAADEAVSQIGPDGSMIRGEKVTWKLPTAIYRKDRLIAIYEGSDDATISLLTSRLGDSFARADGQPTTTVVETKDEPKIGEEEILDLYKRKRLVGRDAYETLRDIYTQRFEEKFAEEIERAYGDDLREMTSWLDEHGDLKRTLYTAIDNKHDNVPAALALFNAIRKQFPREIEKYGELAVAIAVTWDDDNGVYDYTRHQTRTKSHMPEGQMDAVENFRYFIDTENVMQGRAQFLPWEFLIHLVNHKTPLNERQWALQNYLSHREMFGGCYHDVPYDDDMLATQSQIARMNDKDYTLPNLKEFGGVCAMQADYASRVGKSMGVPAEYVRGESRSGDWHAWVMWAELKQVTKTGIAFSLESYGRYRGDKYYVGQLEEPQTGEWITDRELELRMHTVGMNTTAKRHAELIMRSYPVLREQAEMSITDQVVFLNRVINLCPGLEQPWIELSRIATDEEVAKTNFRQMLKTLDNLFKTFANFPDFTWVVFDDLVAFQTDPRKRNEYYQRLVTLYEQAGRPDLACEARLKLTDYLIADNNQKAAIEGLAYTIKKFPDEGRYVPRMLDRLEEICAGVEGAQEQLVVFYRDFLPMIPQMRGNSPSKYCMEIFQRGIVRFRAAGQEQLAQLFDAQLTKIRNGMGRRD